MSKPIYVGTITHEDLYPDTTCKSRDVIIGIQNAIGLIRSYDIGKRVFKVLCDDGRTWIYQVENNEQRDARLAKNGVSAADLTYDNLLGDALRHRDDMPEDTLTISQEKFDSRLEEKLDGCSGAVLLSIEGVYEAVSKYFNDEIIEEWEDEQDDK